jgi:hypothetical protein
MLEGVIAVVMRSPVFWDMTPYCPLENNRNSEDDIASIFRVEARSIAWLRL